MPYRFNKFHDDEGLDSSIVTIVDTEANILASTATAGNLAYASDVYRFFVGDGTNWRLAPFNLVAESANPDMGYTQESSRIGYGTDYVSDKLIANCNIGSNANTTEGSVRISAGYFQIYLNAVWNNVVINFVFKEDATAGYALEHAPVGFSNYYEVNSGNSVALGLNGLPLTQQYSTVMGCYGVPLQVDGGSLP